MPSPVTEHNEQQAAHEQSNHPTGGRPVNQLPTPAIIAKVIGHKAPE
jgi:hypothetical protein